MGTGESYCKYHYNFAELVYEFYYIQFTFFLYTINVKMWLCSSSSETWLYSLIKKKKSPFAYESQISEKGDFQSPT